MRDSAVPLRKRLIQLVVLLSVAALFAKTAAADPRPVRPLAHLTRIAGGGATLAWTEDTYSGPLIFVQKDGAVTTAAAPPLKFGVFDVDVGATGDLVYSRCSGDQSPGIPWDGRPENGIAEDCSIERLPSADSPTVEIVTRAPARMSDTFPASAGGRVVFVRSELGAEVQGATSTARLLRSRYFLFDGERSSPLRIRGRPLRLGDHGRARPMGTDFDGRRLAWLQRETVQHKRVMEIWLADLRTGRKQLVARSTPAKGPVLTSPVLTASSVIWSQWKRHGGVYERDFGGSRSRRLVAANPDAGTHGGFGSLGLVATTMYTVRAFFDSFYVCRPATTESQCAIWQL